MMRQRLESADGDETGEIDSTPREKSVENIRHRQDRGTGVHSAGGGGDSHLATWSSGGFDDRYIRPAPGAGDRGRQPADTGPNDNKIADVHNYRLSWIAGMSI